MFGKLKDKLKSWVKNVSKEVPSRPAPGTRTSEEESVEVLTESSDEKFDSEVEDVETVEKVDEILKEKEKKLEESIKKDKELLEKFDSGKIKEVKIPVEFNAGMKKFEPDLEKISEKEDELIKQIKKDKEVLEELGSEGVSASKEEGVDISTEKEKSIFSRIKSSALGKITISESDFAKYKDDLEMILLENNVAMEAVDRILEDLQDRVVGVEIPKKELETNIKINLGEIIEDILVEPFDIIERIKEKESKPYVILFCGINGAGKTTTIAKFANILNKEGLSCVLAAGDTFRAASIEQLKIHGKKLDVPVIAHDYGSDPAAVGFDAIKYAKKNKKDVVLIDTAGRMHTSKNLMAELSKVARVCKPDSKIFLGESIAGNDSVAQVKAFDEAVSIDGIILSKADIDEKGGTALSVGFVTGKPILYLGVGQEYSDLKKFDKQKFIEELGL